MNYALLTKESNVAVKLDVIFVGLGHQKNGLRYKPVTIS